MAASYDQVTHLRFIDRKNDPSALAQGMTKLQIKAGDTKDAVAASLNINNPEAVA